MAAGLCEQFHKVAWKKTQPIGRVLSQSGTPMIIRKKTAIARVRSKTPAMGAAVKF